MAKLINLNVYDAKNMICVWNEAHPDNGWTCGVGREDADCGFMIPRYFVVGIFDNGTTKVGGISDLDDINDYPEFAEPFLYNEFCYHVSLYAARAFVNHKMGDSGCSEREAKAIVYEELLESGVEIANNARSYLTS